MARPLLCRFAMQAPRKTVQTKQALLYGFSSQIVIDCQIVGIETGKRYVNVRDLAQACRVMKEGYVDLLVMSKTLPSWAREVAADHAKAMGLRVHLVDPRDITNARTVVLAWNRLSRPSSEAKSRAS